MGHYPNPTRMEADMKVGKLLTICTLVFAFCVFGFYAVNRIVGQFSTKDFADQPTQSLVDVEIDADVDAVLSLPSKSLLVDLEPAEPQRAYFPDAIRAPLIDTRSMAPPAFTESAADQISQTQQVAEKPNRVSIPGNAAPIQSPTPADERKRQVIERALPNSTQEERDIWFQELRSLDATMIEEILQLRMRLGRIHSSSEGEQQPLHGNSPNTTPPHGVQRGATLSSQITTTLNSARTAILKNIANVNAVAYRRTVIEFGEFGGELIQSFSDGTNNESTNKGPPTIRSRIDVNQGDLHETRRTLDVAIMGDGWFIVKDGDTECYTRVGTLQINSENEIVFRLGGKTVSFTTPIVVPKQSLSITISETGQVSAVRKTGKDAAITEIGQIMLARFLAPSELKRRGDGTFLPTSASGAAILGEPNADSFGKIRQGYLETANTALDIEIGELNQLNALEKSLSDGVSSMTRSKREPVDSHSATRQSDPLAQRKE